MKILKAKLNMSNRLRDDTSEEYEKNCFSLLDGITALVIKSGHREGYSLIGATDEYAAKFKKAMYYAEQDELFGAYHDDWERFDADWESGNYDPPGDFGLENSEVCIIQDAS